MLEDIKLAWGQSETDFWWVQIPMPNDIFFTVLPSKESMGVRTPLNCNPMCSVTQSFTEVYLLRNEFTGIERNVFSTNNKI